MAFTSIETSVVSYAILVSIYGSGNTFCEGHLMRTAAYTALHYGSPYLGWAIQSVIDYVDEYIVLYAEDGSHGTRTDVQKPESESRDNLYCIAQASAGDKLRWIDGDWRYEHEQRNAIYEHTNAERIIVLDYDEIWPKALIKWTVTESSLHLAYHADQGQIRLPMMHFWRSFQRAIVNDMADPVRILLPGSNQERTRHAALMKNDHTFYKISHMGYAIPSWLCAYKWLTHGHRAEYRTDIDWWQERWEANAQEDTHPTNVSYWNAVEVNPMDYLPGFMRAHPYWNCEMIE